MNEHTATPWTTDGTNIVGADRTVVAYRTNKPAGDMSNQAAIDGRFIVRAVNCHADLLAALKAFVSACTPGEGHTRGTVTLDEIAAGRAAIQKAEAR